MRLSIASFGGEGEIFSTIIWAAVDGHAQVADCAVILEDGNVRPVAYLTKTEASWSLFNKSKPTFALCTEGLDPLDVGGQPVNEIFAHGSWLVAKCPFKYYLWSYQENTGVFSAPMEFCLHADGARAIVGKAVVGFDEQEVLSTKHFAVFRKVDVSSTDTLVATKEVGMFLPKNRTKAKIVGCGSRSFVLASKKQVRSNEYLGHLFAETADGKFAKVRIFYKSLSRPMNIFQSTKKCPH